MLNQTLAVVAAATGLGGSTSSSTPSPPAAPTAAFVSAPMQRREARLTRALRNADRCARGLRRDRVVLERHERELTTTLKALAAKGDLVRARVVARQIAHYRTAGDRNFESAAMIATRAQVQLTVSEANPRL
ncbi:hypothetical protein HK405_002459 [Cladochytrium tenue]|nr:hypothetical protein HK405_002459 [Cladochytrium tenue]